MARDSRLDHFLRLTATPLQADQVYMLAEYAIEASVVALTSQRFSKDRRYARVGERLRKLGLAICGARILYRFMDTLSLVSWWRRLESEKKAPEDRSLHTIERLQVLSALLLAPTEVIWHLATLGALRMKDSRARWIGVISCRAWALYVVLQILHLLRERDILARTKRAYLEATAPLISLQSPELDSGYTSESCKELVEEKKDGGSQVVPAVEEAVEFEATMKGFARSEGIIKDDLLAQAGLLPLTVHWSMDEKLFPPGSAYVGIFGAISAVFGIRRAWKETALVE